MKSRVIYPSTLSMWSDIIKQFIVGFFSLRKRKCTSPETLMFSNLKILRTFSFKRHYKLSTSLLSLLKVNKINSTILGMHTSTLLTNTLDTTCPFLSFPFSLSSPTLPFSVLRADTRALHMVCKHWTTSPTLYLFMQLYSCLHRFQRTSTSVHH